jgi:hypothetical protein
MSGSTPRRRALPERLVSQARETPGGDGAAGLPGSCLRLQVPALEPYVVACEPPFARRVELESRLLALGDEASRLAVVLVHLGQAIEEPRPGCLDVRRPIGADCEFEGEGEGLVGLLVLAEEKGKRAHPLGELGQRVDDLLDVGGGDLGAVEGDGRIRARP